MAASAGATGRAGISAAAGAAMTAAPAAAVVTVRPTAARAVPTGASVAVSARSAATSAREDGVPAATGARAPVVRRRAVLTAVSAAATGRRRAGRAASTGQPPWRARLVATAAMTVAPAATETADVHSRGDRRPGGDRPRWQGADRDAGRRDGGFRGPRGRLRAAADGRGPGGYRGGQDGPSRPAGRRTTGLRARTARRAARASAGPWPTGSAAPSPMTGRPVPRGRRCRPGRGDRRAGAAGQAVGYGAGGRPRPDGYRDRRDDRRGGDSDAAADPGQHHRGPGLPRGAGRARQPLRSTGRAPSAGTWWPRSWPATRSRPTATRRRPSSWRRG